MAQSPTVEQAVETIRRAVRVITENAGRRVDAGAAPVAAFQAAVNEFGERWPGLASIAAEVIGVPR